MSCFSGPQHRGAARQMRARRRSAAEMRQAAERARDAARAAAQPPVRDLTDDEVAELLAAVWTAETAWLRHQIAHVIRSALRLSTAIQPREQSPPGT